MVHQTETFLSREAMPEAKDLFNTTKKIPPEKLHDFLQFMRGVSYGLTWPPVSRCRQKRKRVRDDAKKA